MSWISEAKHAIGYEGDMPGFIEALRALKADPWPTIARGMITPAHIAHPCKAPPPQNDLEESIRDRIARFAATDDLAKDAADAVLEIVRPLAERSDRLEAAEKAVTEAYQRGYATGQEEIEKELAELRSSMKFRTSLIGRTEAERDALRAAVRHEADCVEACKSEIDRLRAENASLVDDMNLLRDNNASLRARIEEMEKQEPYAFAVNFPETSRVELVRDLDEVYEDLIYEAHEVRKLYALPGAKGED